MLTMFFLYPLFWKGSLFSFQELEGVWPTAPYRMLTSTMEKAKVSIHLFLTVANEWTASQLVELVGAFVPVWDRLWFPLVCMCRFVGWFCLHILHIKRFWPFLLKCPVCKQPNHSPFSLKNSTLIWFVLKCFTHTYGVVSVAKHAWLCKCIGNIWRLFICLRMHPCWLRLNYFSKTAPFVWFWVGFVVSWFRFFTDPT